MKLYELCEGGWANTATQNTIIKPTTIRDLMPTLKQFERQLNQYLRQQNIPPCVIGNPVGSGTYYKQDLIDNQDKEYGDIDVQCIIPRVSDKTTAQTRAMYTDAIKNFSNSHRSYETTTGVNVIFHDTPVGPVQIDMVLMFDDRVKWTAALAPERGTKGVLSSSLYSALAQALDISINDDGIHAKTRDGELVPYNQRKNTKTHSISSDHKNWALDIAKFLGATNISNSLKANPGMKQNVKISDIVSSIKGLADTLELNGIKSADDVINDVKSIYMSKINKVINSPKFDKAESYEAKKKADDTKKALAKRSQEIVSLFNTE